LALWIVPALLAVAFWAPKASGERTDAVQSIRAEAEERSAVLRSPISWAIVGLFGLQSLGFYALLGWLPTLLIDRGESPEVAGSYLGLATAIGIPAGLLLSTAIARFKSLAWLVASASTLTLTGLVVLLAAFDNPQLTGIACVMMGLGQAATFPMSLSIISTRAATRAQTTQLSAMAQGWGYLLAAVGTFLVGYLAEVSGSWSVSVVVLIALTAIQVGVGFYSGRPGVIPAK
jgi:CP family cyanate transporter-like MFS transporter